MDKEMRKNPQYQRSRAGTYTTEDIQAILRGDSEKIVSVAKNFAKENLKEKSASSIRKLYSEVKKMKVYNKYNLDLLRAKLAYVSRRHRGLEKLTDLLDDTIKEVKKESFRYFQDFFEAILAYFYKYGRE